MPDSNGMYTGEEVRAMGINPDTLVSNGGKYDVGTIMGGGGYGGSSSGDDYTNKAWEAQLAAVQKLKEYDKANPFAFDAALAKDASTAEYTPYYKELLSDYTTSVEKTKSRSAYDLTETLKQLQAGQEYYSGQARKTVDQSLKSSAEGFAGRGLYMSGAKGAEAKRLEDTYTSSYGPEGYQNGQYLANTEKAKLGTDRTTSDANQLLSSYTRDNTRNLTADIAGGVATRKGEYIQQYETGRKNYYDNQIPGNYFTGIYG